MVLAYIDWVVLKLILGGGCCRFLAPMLTLERDFRWENSAIDHTAIWLLQCVAFEATFKNS